MTESAVWSQEAVNANLSAEQVLPFGYAEQKCIVGCDRALFTLISAVSSFQTLSLRFNPLTTKVGPLVVKVLKI